MRKSARVLGQEYGLTANEMNFVLKEEGFLAGEPANYTVTEKGEKYAEEQDHHRGTGGYAHYNRYWTSRTWDDGITDELDITDDRKKEIRQAISTAKQKTNRPDNEEVVDSVGYSNEDEDTDTTDTDNDALVVAVSVLLVAVSAYGIYKAAPYIKRWWTDRAVPSLKEMKNKAIGRAKKMDEVTDSDFSDF